eukprot:TRINITY_DN22084_c0_g1_i1.p1 TRINITY_DN22084_c0_g1~~TRINITY_DN22084_c0_g1_i1.p1  ORF type:complete len:1128 (+),score=133.13 TRINITY_DN22084_c0_g1_i1:80-3463(+)
MAAAVPSNRRLAARRPLLEVDEEAPLLPARVHSDAPESQGPHNSSAASPAAAGPGWRRCAAAVTGAVVLLATLATWCPPFRSAFATFRSLVAAGRAGLMGMPRHDPDNVDLILMTMYVALSGTWSWLLIGIWILQTRRPAPILAYVRDFLVLSWNHLFYCDRELFCRAIEWLWVKDWLPHEQTQFEKECTKRENLPCYIKKEGEKKPKECRIYLADWEKYMQEADKDPTLVGIQVYHREGMKALDGSEGLAEGNVVSYERVAKPSGKPKIKVCWHTIHKDEFERGAYPVQGYDVRNCQGPPPTERQKRIMADLEERSKTQAERPTESKEAAKRPPDARAPSGHTPAVLSPSSGSQRRMGYLLAAAVADAAIAAADGGSSGDPLQSALAHLKSPQSHSSPKPQQAARSESDAVILDYQSFAARLDAAARRTASCGEAASAESVREHLAKHLESRDGTGVDEEHERCSVSADTESEVKEPVDKLAATEQEKGYCAEKLCACRLELVWSPAGVITGKGGSHDEKSREDHRRGGLDDSEACGVCVRMVPRTSWALRTKTGSCCTQIKPGELIRHNTGPKNCGAAWFQRWTYLTLNHRTEDGVRHEIVWRLGDWTRRALITFTLLSVFLAGTCVVLCLSVFLPVWERRVRAVHAPDYGQITAPETYRHPIVDVISNARLTCELYGQTPTPLIVSAVQTVLTNFVLVFFMGLPLAGKKDMDWRHLFRRGRRQQGDGEDGGCCACLCSLLGDDSTIGSTKMWREERGAWASFGTYVFSACMFLYAYLKVFRLWRAGDLGLGGWDSYQTALVIVFCHPSTIAFVQVLTRLSVGETEEWSLQRILLWTGFAFIGIAAVPGMVTHGLLSLYIVFETLVLFPLVAPGLVCVTFFVPGALPAQLEPWEMALALRSILASIGSLLLCMLVAIVIHSVLQYPVTLLKVACMGCFYKRAQDKWERALQNCKPGKDPPTIPIGAVIRMHLDEAMYKSTFYKNNSLLGRYAEHRGRYCGSNPIWEFDNGRGIGLPYAKDKGPTRMDSRICDFGGPCDTLRPTMVFNRWRHTIGVSASAVAWAVCANFALQSSVVYMVFIFAHQYTGLKHLEQVPEDDYNARNFFGWWECQKSVPPLSWFWPSGA